MQACVETKESSLIFLDLYFGIATFCILKCLINIRVLLAPYMGWIL